MLTSVVRKDMNQEGATHIEGIIEDLATGVAVGVAGSQIRHILQSNTTSAEDSAGSRCII